jgi:hypothetical protein
MSSLSHDFVTVDMRGLKRPLVERAQSERVSVSVVVRRAVARELNVADPATARHPCSVDSGSIKVSIRLSTSEARVLRARALTDGTSMGALLAGFARGIPEAAVGPARADLLRALVESSAELSTLNRNVHHLVVLLGQGSVQAAREYREMLDALTGDVRSHLQLASAALADLHPSGPAPIRQDGRQHRRSRL